MKAKVVVFGGSGFIGSYVVEELLKNNYRVFVADLHYAPYYPEELFIPCNILDQQRVEEIITADVDFVYNFAGFANLDEAADQPLSTIELNINGNLHILEACRKQNLQRFVFASSAYAMSNKGSFYGISKLSSEKIIEEYAKRYGLHYTIVRYGSVYSERASDNNYIYNLVKEAISSGKIVHSGNGEETREYIHAADAAALSVRLIEDKQFRNQCIVLTGVERMKRIELFQMINETLNNEINIELKNDGYLNHYKITPYSFHPTFSKKLVANPYIDMGQGILECIKNIYEENGNHE